MQRASEHTLPHILLILFDFTPDRIIIATATCWTLGTLRGHISRSIART